MVAKMYQLTANVSVELPVDSEPNSEDKTKFTVEGKEYYLDSLRFLSQDGGEINLNIFDIIRITVEE